MTKHTNPTPVSDEQVRTLLERYNCPVPFHEVRTRFLGNIATPVISASPIKMVEKLWGGELPAFDFDRRSERVDWRACHGLVEQADLPPGPKFTLPPDAYR